MNTKQITKTNELIDKISFKFTKIKETKKYLDIVFVFGSAENKISVPENTSIFVNALVKVIPKFSCIFPKKYKSYHSQRQQFLEYTTDFQSNFKFVTIEKLYDDLKEFGVNLKGITAKRTDLVKLELKAIDQAYSLIIFPESVGSYAELGYFTAIDDTKKKMYVANHYEFTGQESYLNHLIDDIHNPRGLRTITIDFYSNDISKTQKQFKEIVDNLKQKYDEDIYEKYQKTNKLQKTHQTGHPSRLHPASKNARHPATHGGDDPATFA